MAQFPTMPLRTDALLGDTGHLSATEFGQYMRLLMAAWQSDVPLLPAKALEGLLLGVEQWDRHVEWARHPYFWPDGDWPTVRALVIERDGEVCRYCGATDGPFHVDHILARARGGSNSADNLCVACQRCNTSKGAKLLSEWRGSDG